MNRSQKVREARRVSKLNKIRKEAEDGADSRCMRMLLDGMRRIRYAQSITWGSDGTPRHVYNSVKGMEPRHLQYCVAECDFHPRMRGDEAHSVAHAFAKKIVDDGLYETHEEKRHGVTVRIYDMFLLEPKA